MTITIAKQPDGKIVQIVRVSSQVQFAEGTFIMICGDWQQREIWRTDFRWVPADVRFEWVKSFQS